MGLQNTICRTAKLSLDILKRNKETVLLISGLAAGLGTVVTASKGTLAAKDIIEEHKQNVKDINEASETDPEYKDSDIHKKDVIKNCVCTSTKLVKAYAPSVVLGATSVCCILAQHKMMTTKVVKLEETVASLSAAYIAVDTAFKKYRKRVIDKYGEKEDAYFRYGLKEDTIEITEADEKGKTKKHKEKILTIDSLDKSDYAKFFDGSSEEFIFQDPMKYKPDWDANLRTLMIRQKTANDILIRDGYLFLNDVYDLLGMEKTKAGQVVGWIYDPENPNIDSCVDFKIISPIKDADILDAYGEEGILVDFNVDGIIIDKLSKFPDT